MKIIPLNKTHVREISKIHQKELNIGVINLFGIKFLEKLYYELLKKNYGFVAKSGNEIIGFITATKKKFPLFKCISTLSIIIFFYNIFRNFNKFKSFLFLFYKIYLNKNLNNKVFSSDKSIELFSFAVKEKYKGRGVGRKLIQELECKAKKDFTNFIFTTTHNYKLVDFYFKSKKAYLLEKIVLNNYDLMTIRWKL